MFTPQQKKGWGLSPRVGDGVDNGSVLKGRSGGLVLKGKGKNAVDAPPPPPLSMMDDVDVGGVVSGGEREDWRRFQEAGLLDPSAMLLKDLEALLQRNVELGKELHEYQYNMGLLLIEKKKWASQFEELRATLAETQETLKREQTAHLIAVSEFEKREETLRKALGVEKQCVADLEKALREMRSEIAEVKFTADKKLDEARALETGLEDKYMEVEGKVHSVEAKLAEASRKNSEVERKLDELESRERKLQKEYMSFTSERKIHEKDLAEQREHLRDWEKRLQENQRRLNEGQRFLNEREEQCNEADKRIKKRESELEETRKSSDAAKISLMSKEEEITTRLNSLAAKEKEVSVKIGILEKKEKDLASREEKVEARERVEVQKLVEEHKAKLDLERQAFESDLEKRRTAVEEELKKKIDESEKKKKETERMQDQLMKKEQALKIDRQKLEDREKDFDSKAKALKKWEESVRNDEKKLEKEKQQLKKDTAELQKLKAELEDLRAAVGAGKDEIIKREKALKLTEEEREEYSLLQSKLKQEIEDNRIMKESLHSDTEDLREQRKKIEKEWEALDEKRSSLETEIEKVNEEKEMFEKWRTKEQERLKMQDLASRANIERENEELRLKTETFEKKMAHDKSDALETLRRERADMAREHEIRMHELEMDMQIKQEEMERKFQEKENEFLKMKDLELNQIKSSKSSNDSKLQRLNIMQNQIEREKEELAAQSKKIDDERTGIQKDIAALSTLSRNLKDQREELIKERNRFLSQAEHCKICRNCGFPVGDLELLGLQETGNIQLPNLGFEEQLRDKSVEASPQPMVSQARTSGGHLSLLQKCSRLFRLSPGKKPNDPSEDVNMSPFSDRLDREALGGEATASSLEAAIGSSHTYEVNVDPEVKPNEESERLVELGEEQVLPFGAIDNYGEIPRIPTNNESRDVVEEQIILSADQIEREEFSQPMESDSQPESTKQSQRQTRGRGRGKGSVRRTRTMKAVVEDAKAILGETSEMQLNGEVKESSNVKEEDPILNDTKLRNARQKRRLGQISGNANEADVEDSEAHSESISVGGRRKRRQVTAPVTEVPGGKRYNLRRSRVAGTTTKSMKTGGRQESTENEAVKESGDGEGASKPAVEGDNIVADSMNESHMLQKPAAESFTGVQEVSSYKIVRFEAEVLGDAQSNDNIVTKSVEIIDSEDGFEVDGAATSESEPATPSESGSGGDDEDDEEVVERRSASIGKKLWTFFTT